MISPPTDPRRFIIALPFERRGFGVISGISETAGERKVLIERSARKSAAIKITRFSIFAEIGISIINMTAETVPTIM